MNFPLFRSNSRSQFKSVFQQRIIQMPSRMTFRKSFIESNSREEREKERYTVLYETKPVYHYSLLDPDRKSKENGQISCAWVKRCAGEPSRYFIFHIHFILYDLVFLTMSRKWRDCESNDWRIISKKMNYFNSLPKNRIIRGTNEIIEMYILNFLTIVLNIWMNNWRHYRM